ncbi:MAG TPA: NAD(P)/FAD-dependent oxidoreductase [Candidatus Baltobacteraceae bacterium]|jgi:geranylgeranyl reductase|nr:NAD(P)/FAD-dependent oxidoreductase [Candidatus Baltobacteraceae bacterium]
MVEDVEFLVVGCGPAGGIAAREAARCGVDTVVLEKDSVVGAKRVCAAGLRPGFCAAFDVPRSIIHCDTPRLALFDVDSRQYEVFFGPGHTTTREELDGTIGDLARAAGAQVRTSSLFRAVRREADRTFVEYADVRTGERRTIAARHVFFAQGSTAKLEQTAFAYADWNAGLVTTLQYRIYLQRPAEPIAYQTLEMHYFPTEDGRMTVAWMFPKRDHLAIGLGVLGKMDGVQLRRELDRFTNRVERRLYHGIPHTIKTEGHLLYGDQPRPMIARAGEIVGGTAAGLVDATNGEGIYEAAMSGRFAAQAVASRGGNVHVQYERAVKERFYRRLRHRARLMRYLERRPARYALLFEQLQGSARFADILQREDPERTLADRLHLYGQALRFAARAGFV